MQNKALRRAKANGKELESIMLRTAFQTKHLYKLRPISVQRISCIFVQTKKIADVLQGCKTQAIVSVSVYK